MSKYLIKLTPLEYYFFGDENAFHFDGERNDSYYASSIAVPPQTSIIGMLRYMILEQNGLLKSDGSYPDTEKINEYIGENGYSIENPTRELGKIIDISPLFIIDEDGEKYIKIPLNHKAGEEKYTPFEMGDEIETSHSNETSHKKIRLPRDGEYDAKASLGGKYLKISDMTVVDSIFESNDERVGIKKAEKDDAFVKKCYRKLKDGFSFAVIAEFEDDIKLHNSVCYMGREKSAFRFEVSETDEEFAKTVRSPQVKDKFYYAASDLFLKEKIKFSDFSVVQTGSLRALESKIEKGRLTKTRQKKFYNVIKAGSVFYGEKPGAFYEEKYGVNAIIEFG